jgi:hypothetical protein
MNVTCGLLVAGRIHTWDHDPRSTTPQKPLSYRQHTDSSCGTLSSSDSHHRRTHQTVIQSAECRPTAPTATL